MRKKVNTFHKKRKRKEWRCIFYILSDRLKNKHRSGDVMMELHNTLNGSESQIACWVTRFTSISNTTQILKVFAGYLSIISSSAA